MKKIQYWSFPTRWAAFGTTIAVLYTVWGVFKGYLNDPIFLYTICLFFGAGIALWSLTSNNLKIVVWGCLTGIIIILLTLLIAFYL